MFDIAIEVLRTLILTGLVLFLLMIGRRYRVQSHAGWAWVVGGFGLLLFGSLIDITDNFPELNGLVVFGDTPAQAALEKLVGYLGGFAALTIGMTRWITGQLTRHRDVEARLNDTSVILDAALGAMDQGFLVWDDEDRVVVCNARYHEIWGYPPNLLKPGTPLIELLRYRATCGAYGEGDPEVLAQTKLKQVFSREPQQGSNVQNIAGRVIASRRYSMNRFEYITICSDMTALKQAETALIDSEARFRDFAETASDWFWEIDESLRYTFVSDRAGELCDIPTSKLVGKSREEIGMNMLDEGVLRNLQDLEARRPFTDFVCKRVRRDGTELFLASSGRPVFDADGSFKGYRGTGRDITAQKHAEGRLEHAKAVAERASRAKSDFLANMSHELRTPLNTVIGFSQIIMDGLVGKLENPKYTEYARDIHSAGTHLLELINDILDISRIEAGEMVIEKSRVCVDDLVESSLRLVRFRADEKNQAIIVDLPDGAVEIHGDNRLLRQVVVNLLSNAIKFTPEGGRVSVGADIDESGGVMLKVSDTGIGIAAHEIPKAIEPFGQIRQSSTHTHEGTGLGLSLSNRLVELHGGNLSIESEVGIGTTATIAIPPENVLAT